jgi:hypothetical protein
LTSVALVAISRDPWQMPGTTSLREGSRSDAFFVVDRAKGSACV